jgi:hypothetical protein
MGDPVDVRTTCRNKDTEHEVHNVFYYEDHASPDVMLLFHSSSSVSPITHLHTPRDHHVKTQAVNATEVAYVLSDFMGSIQDPNFQKF